MKQEKNKRLRTNINNGNDGQNRKRNGLYSFFKVEDKENMSNVWPNRNMSAILERIDVC
jgi:uncharacterized Zn-finger protein